MPLERHIVFLTDDGYILPTCVALQSLTETLRPAPDRRYIAHVCAWNLREEHVCLLENMRCAPLELRVDLVTKSQYAERFSRINQKSHVSPVALLKFELPNLYPDADTMLYLDGDIIVKRDLSPLLETDVSGVWLGAVLEFWKYMLWVYQYSGGPEPAFYFNSGVLLLNLAQMRRENVPERLWEAKFEHFNDPANKKKFLMDQDAFNEVCASHALPLSIIWNCDPKLTKEANLSIINEKFGTDFHSLRELYDAAHIIHYIGKDEKPWKFVGTPKQELWQSYFEKSPFRGAALEQQAVRRGGLWAFSRLIGSIRYRGLLKTLRYLNDRRKLEKS